MKKILLYLGGIILIFSQTLAAQTAGTLTFSFNQPTPTAPAPTYTGTQARSVLAVWIENSTGTFIKSKMRYVGSSTSDHLPTYAVKAGGAASNALATGVNITDATTGATLKTTTTPVAFGARTTTWDGKNVVGATNGTTVADGNYNVWIESTWVDAGSNNHQVLESYAFTKGATAVHLTPTSTSGYFTTIDLTWTPTGLGFEDLQYKEPAVVIYPVPSTGIFNLDFKNEIKNIKVYNLLGQTVYSEALKNNAETTKQINLSNLLNGNYVISLSNENGVSNYEVILKK